MQVIYKTPKFKVFHVIPWNSEKSIGTSYNEVMDMVGNNDWVCFLDGDAIHTTTYFGKRIEDVIIANPEYSLFTSYTNRVNCQYQIPDGVDVKTNDQKYHREFGEKLWQTNSIQVMDVTNLQLLSGVLILLKKSAWKKVGGFKEGEMLSVDNDIHYKIKLAGEKVGLMKGIYVQHWYRGGNNKEISHLI